MPSTGMLHNHLAQKRLQLGENLHTAFWNGQDIFLLFAFAAGAQLPASELTWCLSAIRGSIPAVLAFAHSTGIHHIDTSREHQFLAPSHNFLVSILVEWSGCLAGVDSVPQLDVLACFYDDLILFGLPI